ncbi:MAG: hypothetical protein AAFX40_10945 [Cyanobacteria bacterium J06639_1]
MNVKTLLPNVLQYAIALCFCWLLLTNQVSDDTFLWLFLVYGLFNFVIRRRSEKSED